MADKAPQPARPNLRPRLPPPSANPPAKTVKRREPPKKKQDPPSTAASDSTPLPPESEEGQSPAPQRLPTPAPALPSAEPTVTEPLFHHHGITTALPSWTTLSEGQRTPAPEEHNSSSLTPVPPSVLKRLSSGSKEPVRTRQTYKEYRDQREARILAKVGDRPFAALPSPVRPSSSSHDAPNLVGPVTPPLPARGSSPPDRTLSATSRSPPRLGAKHSYRPGSRASAASKGSSGEESLPGAPPRMHYTELFGLDDQRASPASEPPSPDAPSFDELPVGPPRLGNFYIGRAGGPHPEFHVLPHDPNAPVSPKIYIARGLSGPNGPNGTPPQKSIIRGDHFMASEERAYYDARAALSPEKYAGFSGREEQLIAAADLAAPIVLRRGAPDHAAPGGTQEEVAPVQLPPAEQTSPPRTPSRTLEPSAPPEGNHDIVPAQSPEPVPPPVPDQQDASPPLQGSRNPSPLTHDLSQHSLPSPGSDSGQPHIRTSLRGPKGNPPGARRAPGRAASSALRKGAFAGAQADSDSPSTSDEFHLSDTPHKDKMRLFEDLEDEGEPFNFGNDDPDDDAPAPRKRNGKRTLRHTSARPSPADTGNDSDADDDAGEDSPPRASRKDKGKRAQRNASAGPSHSSRGRPTTEVNQEIEQVAHRMQAELVNFAQKVGMSYETLLRKMGFTQQEVRDPNLSNIFKQVHKERLRAAGKGKLTVAEYNTAFKAWQTDHGDDPVAIADLFKEHTAYQTADDLMGKPDEKMAKNVSSIAQQMAKMSNAYFMAGNIAVVGAVINLNSADAAQTFAPTIGHQAALVQGFGYDEQAALLKAKSLLILAADATAQAETAAASSERTSSRWTVKGHPRDAFRAMVKSYLTDSLAHLDDNKGPKWDPRKWSSIADLHQLVLTGWGPGMPTVPTAEWVDKSRGALTKIQWQALVSRIPAEYHNNPFYSVPVKELPLEIIPLDDFLASHKEYDGRHPFVVDHTGRALAFVDESTPALRGTGSKKRQPRSRSSRSQRKVAKEDSEAHSTGDSDSQVPIRAPPPTRQRLRSPAAPAASLPTRDTDDLSDRPANTQSRQDLLHAARTSPSGHVKKRVRTEQSDRQPDSPPRSGDDRPVRPLPRPAWADLKRKHVEVASLGPHGQPTIPHVRAQLPPPARRPPDYRAHMGPVPAEATAPAAMYPRPFHPQPFPQPHPYPHDGYMQPVYGHHPYPQPYAPQGWGPPPPHHPHEQWPPGPARFNRDDGDQYNPTGRRPYGPGP